MSDSKPMGIDGALFQLQSSGVDRTLSRVKSGPDSQVQKPSDLDAASRQFESLLLNFMIREMRATVPESSLFPPSMAQDIFTSMLDERYADAMADTGGIGLHRLLIDQLEDVAGEK